MVLVIAGVVRLEIRWSIYSVDLPGQYKEVATRLRVFSTPACPPEGLSWHSCSINGIKLEEDGNTNLL